jgi:phosphoglycolate phosphatase-like HAD superfamily hydrolase
MKKTFERFGDEAPSAERITVNIGLPLEEAISDLAPDLSREQIEERASFYRKIYSEEGVENIRPMQGVAKLLERLSNAGVRMALVSNKRDDVLGWKRYFGFAGGVLEDGISKPDPAFRIEEMRKAFQDVEAAEILMVGDTKEDMIYARNLGVDACLALYGYGRSAQARIEAPDFEVRMPEEIESVVL